MGRIKLREFSISELKKYFHRVTKLKPTRDSIESLAKKYKYKSLEKILLKLDSNDISEEEHPYWLAICKRLQEISLQRRPRVKKSTYRKSELPKEAKNTHCFGTNVTKIRSGKLRINQDILPDKPIQIIGIIKKSSSTKS